MASEMREPTYLVLTALAAGRRHGYGLVGDVAALSQGRVKLRAGTLYAMLDRLVQEGLVAPAGEEIVDGRLRRYYELNAAGAAELAVVARRMAEVSEVAMARLRVIPGLA